MTSFESFADDAKTVASANRRRDCLVGALLKRLDDADAQEVRAALARPELTGTAIHQALKTRVSTDTLPSSHTIQRHRRGGCGCETA